MSGGKRKILIVDDAGPVIVLCVNVLQARGYAVRGTHRGEAALEMVRQEAYDLMVVDYKMPGLNGFEVFERARALRPEMRFVLVTGHGTPEVLQEAAARGFHGVLTKPFTPDQLRQAVERALAAQG